jgi:hypothetical protein
MAASQLSIVEAFASARAYLGSEAAKAMHAVGVTYDTVECGLVTFAFEAGELRGREVAR